MPGPLDNAVPLAVASTDPFYATLRLPEPPPAAGHAPAGWGGFVGPSVRPDLRADQLLSDIWPQPYRGPLDLDNFGRETPEMRRAFRELYAKEPAVRASIDGRAAAVAALDVSVLADDADSDDDKRVAEFVDWCVERTPHGWDGLALSVIKPALIDGFSVLEVTLEEVASRKWGKRWGLKHVRSIDTAHVKLQMDQYRNIINVVNTVRGLEYHGPRKEVVFTHGELFHNPFGMAVLRPAYRNAYLINVAYEIWATAIKVFGAPVVTGKYKQAETRGILERALQALRAGGWMTVPDGAEVEVLNFASATGFDAFEAHVAKCREEIYLAVRGAYLPFTQGSGGADQRGDTATHKVASDALEYLDAKAVARCLTRQLVPHLVRPNFGDAVGLPKVVLGGTNWGETKQQLEVAAQLQQLGLPLSKKQMYETGQHSPPADDDDTLAPPSAPPPGGGPGGPQPLGSGPGGPGELFADKAADAPMPSPLDAIGQAVLDALGVPAQFDGFDESKHPRDGGKFAPKGGGDSGGSHSVPESVRKSPRVVEAAKKLAAGAKGLAARINGAAIAAGVTPETVIGSPEDWQRIWITHHADVVMHHLGVDAMTAGHILTHLIAHAIEKVKPLLTKGVGFAEWEESKHNRNHGKFAPKGSGDSGPDQPTESVTKPAAKPATPAKTAPAKTAPAKANTLGGGTKVAKAPRVPEGKPSERAARAKAAHKLIGKEVQRYAEEHNEPRFAEAIGGLSWKDNEPVDVTIGPADKPRHGIEVKTLVDNGNGKITMKRSAMDLKAAWEKEHGAKFHTVVLDDQRVFNAGGPGKHDESKRRIFYRRGYGSFRVGTMHEVTGGMAELKKLMATPDDKLPPAARRSSRGA